MFRFICELCRLNESDRKTSKEQLTSLLNYATPGTITFIADINPWRRSPAQPELVASFIESVFMDEMWDRVGFLQKLWKKSSRSLEFFNIWDLDVHPVWTLIDNVSEFRKAKGLDLES